MNFINDMEGQGKPVELKYCERCGGLWLRSQGTDGVYCASCRVRLAEMPDPGEPSPCKARRSRRVCMKEEATGFRKGAQEDVEGEEVRNLGQIDCLQGRAAMEVWG
jgi:Zn-finger nucleic acid-binding protein